MLRIAEIVEKTEVEGPGLRSALWFQGCTINCPSCCNQSFLPLSGGSLHDPVELASYLAGLDTEGLTILGGEPLQQSKELRKFMKYFRSLSDKGIMLFSGYTWEVITKNEMLKETVSLCDLVVAGPFDETQSPDNRRWIGSVNQTIHFITDYYDFLKPWPEFKKEIEFHIRGDQLIINGTPLKLGLGD